MKLSYSSGWSWFCHKSYKPRSRALSKTLDLCILIDSLLRTFIFWLGMSNKLTKNFLNPLRIALFITSLLFDKELHLSFFEWKIKCKWSSIAFEKLDFSRSSADFLKELHTEISVFHSWLILALSTTIWSSDSLVFSFAMFESYI